MNPTAQRLRLRPTPRCATSISRSSRGPLLDRIDIHVEVPAVPYRELTGSTPAPTAPPCASRSLKARDIQHKRFADGGTNARMDSRQLKAHCELSDSCLLLMKQAMDELGFEAPRAFDKVRRVARTIADLAGLRRSTRTHRRGGTVSVADRKF